MRSKLLCLILLSFSVALFSCKKDKDDSLSSVKKNIIGTWEVQSVTEVRYDASGKQVDTRDLGVNPGTQVRFIDQTTVNDGSIDKDYPYSLNETEGKATLTIDNQTYNIRITNGTMTWALEAEVINDSYSKSVITYQFKKV
ncbi:hypothetical protein D0C36_06995 [Mucilaginibacter conchicola]|uniref:Lipocalin-like domain-containing protein n=1 Tax=Mucilaginibacter conchicola TaxID=2303333 RepID=A0A372NYS1_9SPHI|nr:hypothetical protein [Mucilaginibacter conchicola]RFZ95268.1 hypothetical protein D0C36_06995 [Mucilaginibacter conchicola]